MYRTIFLASAFSAGMSAVSSAAFIYVSDFTGAASGDTLQGVDGWGQSHANPLEDGEEYPLAWVSDLGGSPAASVGGYYGSIDTATQIYAHNSVGTSFASSSLSVKFGLQDSTTDFQFRNDFSFSLVNAADENLFSVNLTATNQIGDYDDFDNPADLATSNAAWNVGVTSIGISSPGASFAAVSEDSIYSLSVLFTANGADIDYQLYLSLASGAGPTVIDAGTLVGMSSETIDELRINFSQGSGTAWGDNFLTFNAVPEPSVFLLSGLAGLAFLRRRRR